MDSCTARRRRPGKVISRLLILGLTLALILSLVPRSAQATPPEPYLVKDINPNTWVAPEDLTAVNGTLFFRAGEGPYYGGSGSELWQSDGTTAGTVLVKDINSPRVSAPRAAPMMNPILFQRRR